MRLLHGEIDGGMVGHVEIEDLRRTGFEDEAQRPCALRQRLLQEPADGCVDRGLPPEGRDAMARASARSAPSSAR